MGKAQRLLQLIECVDLDFDLDHMARALAQALQRLGQPAGGGDVIVLHQHRVDRGRSGG